MTATPKGGLLYVCYLSLDDPLVETQVVAYLDGLKAAGYRTHLMTFEVRRLSREEREQRSRMLADRGISWHPRRYHKAPSLPATLFDVVAGALVARILMRRHRLTVFHARSHVPAAVGLIARIGNKSRTVLVFDVRGLMAEEYEDAGRWKRNGIPFRLTKWVEGRALDRAHQIVVLTHRLGRMFQRELNREVTVIPCCVDLERVAHDVHARVRVRSNLNLGDATTLVYVGKLTGWYMADEMAGFFASAKQVIPDLHLLVLTQDDSAGLVASLERLGVASRDVTITACPPHDLGRYLSAADAALSFIRPAPSKISSSPTKVGEYLGAGLPLVCTSGVGDLDEILDDDVAVLLADHSPESYLRAASRLFELIAESETGRRCVSLARQEFDLATLGIPAYVGLYEKLETGPG